jgi:hypothetical protein
MCGHEVDTKIFVEFCDNYGDMKLTWRRLTSMKGYFKDE